MSAIREVTRIFYGFFVPSSVLFPLVPALRYYRRNSRPLRILAWYLVLSGATSLISVILAFRRINNMPIMHLYTFAEFWVLTTFYRTTIGEVGRRYHLKYLAPGFFLICIANAVYGQSIYTFNTYTKSLESVLMLALGILYFKKELDLPAAYEKSKRDLLNVNSSLLIYFSGSFVLFTIYNVIVYDVKFVSIMFAVHSLLLLSVYLVTGTVLWRQKV